jgi:predicted metal-dependent hydrolase
LSLSLHQIKYGSQLIDYELIHRDRKSLGIKVYPDCSVKVFAPQDSSLEKVESKVHEKARWILKQQNEFLSYHPLTPPRQYVNGETHLYLGRQYRLRIEFGTEKGVKLFRGRLIVSAQDQKDVERIINDWYREKAKHHFKDILEMTFLKFKKYSIPFPELSIRQMPTRWGSCTPKGKVILNPELVKAPKGCIEYVIIHELCHLIEHNHTKAFYDLQETIFPEWKKWKERLEYQLV